MDPVERDRPLRPSLLDRLLDDDPELLTESPGNEYQVLQDVKRSVRRDLENLLNTRRHCMTSPFEKDKLLERSLLNYGIPDPTGTCLSNPRDREVFRREIERAIELFLAPQLSHVRVELMEDPSSLERTLHFRIEAILAVDPSGDPLVFDSTLEPVTADFTVKKAQR